MVPRSLRVPAVIALAVASASLLSSCSGLQLAFGSTTGAAYAEVAAFRADTTLPAPSWVPDDATDIRYTTDLVDRSAILMYRSPTRFQNGSCDVEREPEDSSVAPIVPLDDSWWPESLPTTLFGCGDDWTTFVDGDIVYGFTTGSADAPSERRSTADSPSLP